MHTPLPRSLRWLWIPLLLSLLLGGCFLPKLPQETPELPDLPELPNLPDIPPISELPDLLDELGLPDLSGIANLPGLEDLPSLATPEGAIAFAGPTERRIDVGQAIPGTDIQLVAVSEEGAEFQIAGLRSLRTVGDSLDYDGPWPGAQDVTYNLRLRIYRLGTDHVRVAGVHRVEIRGIQPTLGPVSLEGGNQLLLPYSGQAQVGETLKGLTYGYRGLGDRGAELFNLPEGEYPFRKTGDSIVWTGLLRPDIPVRYSLRVAHYTESTLRVVGTVKLRLP